MSSNESVRLDVQRSADDLVERVRRAKAAACSLPSPKPVERELLELLRGIRDPEQRRALHVTLESMQTAWEALRAAGRRCEAKGVPWIVVARESVVAIVERLQEAAAHRALSPDESLQFKMISRLLVKTQPEWEAFCAVERRKDALANDVRAAERRPLTDRACRNRRDAETGDEALLPELVKRVLRGEVNKTIKGELRISEQRLKRIRRRAVREGKIPPRGKGLRAPTNQ